jgi:hypothetical protein
MFWILTSSWKIKLYSISEMGNWHLDYQAAAYRQESGLSDAGTST